MKYTGQYRGIHVPVITPFLGEGDDFAMTTAECLKTMGIAHKVTSAVRYARSAPIKP